MKQIYYKRTGVLDDMKMSFFDYIMYNIVIKWVVVILLMVIISCVSKNMFEKWEQSKLIILMHILLALTSGFFIYFVFIFTVLAIDQNFKFSLFWEYFIDEYMQFLDYNMLVYFSMIGIIYGYYYLKRIKLIEEQKSKLEYQLVSTRLKVLQSQLHPHFLFNTLNSIHSLMDTNTIKSKEMIVDLGDILREVLDNKDKNLIELQDELHLLNKYINIKKTRFSDHLNFHISIEDDLENVLVPNMLIQPIVENAIKHGYNKNILKLNVYLFIYKRANKLIIKVENNGKKINNKTSTLLNKGTGLSNINDRLQSLFNTNYELKIYNENKKVITKVCFPIKLAISELSTED
ncbi:sensor histidine kinase [Psychroserpens sp. MEBiC05023]